MAFFIKLKYRVYIKKINMKMLIVCELNHEWLVYDVCTASGNLHVKYVNHPNARSQAPYFGEDLNYVRQPTTKIKLS